MAFTSTSEVSLCSKLCTDSYNQLKTLYDEQLSLNSDQEVKLVAYDLAVKKLEAQIVSLQK